MALKSFAWNWEAFVRDLTPPRLRSAFMVKWLFTLSKPIRDLHAELLTYRTAVNKPLTYSNQTKALEAYLRAEFSENGITITNNDLNTSAPVLRGAVTDDTKLVISRHVRNLRFPVVSRHQDWTTPSAFHFTIDIPIAQDGVLNQTKLEAIVNANKLPFVNFNVTYS